MGRKLPLETLAPSPEEFEEHQNLISLKIKLDSKAKEVKVEKKGIRGKAKEDKTKELDKLEIQSACVSALTNHLLMRTRNKKVTRELQAKFKDETGDPFPFKVYCVSNTHYAEHLEGYSLNRTIPCPVDLTGIPSLRLCAMTLPSKNKFEDIWQRWRVGVPELVLKTSVWCGQSVMLRRNDLRQLITHHFEKVDEVVDAYGASVLQAFESSVLKVIKDRNQSWKAHGISTASGWANKSRFSFAKYGARYKAYGMPGIKEGCQVSWNDELLKPVVKDLTSSWTAFSKLLRSSEAELQDGANEMLSNVRETTKGNVPWVSTHQAFTNGTGFPGASEQSVKAFTSVVQGKREKIKKLVEASLTKLKAATEKLKSKCTTSDGTFFLSLAMEPIYEACNDYGGKQPRQPAS